MRIWSVKAWVVPIVVGALGCTTKKLEEHLKNTGLSRINSSLQISALLGAANILRKTLALISEARNVLVSRKKNSFHNFVKCVLEVYSE